MQNSLVSVIITVYNVEEYIEKCLNSVLRQTYENLEIICIEDCGNDNSYNIIKSYEENDNRIKVIKNINNFGPGKSRNNGINMANGDYIYFIDGDDYIDQNYIENMVIKIKEHNVNVVCNAKILKIYKDKQDNKFIKKETDFILNKKLEWNKNFAKTMPTSAWSKLYNLKFLKDNKIYFAENNLRFEDFYFNEILKTRIKTICFIYNSTYYYRQREGSIMNSSRYNKNDCYDSIYIMKELHEYYRENNLLNKHPLPLKWLYKFFKNQNNKQKFFNEVRKILLQSKYDILKHKKIYDKSDMNFLKSVLNNEKYNLFKIEYIIRKIFSFI